MQPHPHLAETTVEETQVYRGNFLDVRRDTVGLPDGSRATREYVVHPGAVMVVAIDDDGRLVVERQYRYPLHQAILEFPAGKIDPGESRKGTAIRELFEETGYTAEEWARAALIHNAPAYSTELIELWFARKLKRGERKLDAGEFLDVELMSEGELDALAGAGELTDVKTLAGLMWLQKWRAGHWQLHWEAVDA